MKFNIKFFNSLKVNISHFPHFTIVVFCSYMKSNCPSLVRAIMENNEIFELPNYHPISKPRSNVPLCVASIRSVTIPNRCMSNDFLYRVALIMFRWTVINWYHNQLISINFATCKTSNCYLSISTMWLSSKNWLNFIGHLIWHHLRHFHSKNRDCIAAWNDFI